MTPHYVGYLRVSTQGQTVANQEHDVMAQLRALNATSPVGAACTWRVEREIESGAKSRPRLEKLCASLRAGDVLGVWALDRLGRNAVETIMRVHTLLERGVRVVSVREPWLDQPGPTRGLLLSVMAWVAEQERNRLIERTNAGLARARAEGRTLGRPRLLDTEPVRRGVERYRKGSGTLRQCAASAGVSVATLKRAVTQCKS